VNTHFDLWIVATLLTLFALLASIRLSLPYSHSVRLGRIGTVLTHPAWLIPFILMMSMAIGWMMQGKLSPWPPEAAQQLAQRSGSWAGVTAFVLVLLVDLWLLWTPSMIARRYSTAELQGAMRGLSVINVVFGALFLLAVYFITR